MTLKICSKCGEEKDLEREYSRNRKSAGGRHSQCKDCRREYVRVTASAVKEYRNTWYRENYKHIILKGARRRAIQRGIPFALTEDDIEIPAYCPVCARELRIAADKARSNSLSLDKWEPSLGYVPGNVWIICNRCNTRKRDMSPVELLAFAHQVIDSFIMVDITREKRNFLRTLDEE